MLCVCGVWSFEVLLGVLLGLMVELEGRCVGRLCLDECAIALLMEKGRKWRLEKENNHFMFGIFILSMLHEIDSVAVLVSCCAAAILAVWR